MYSPEDLSSMFAPHSSIEIISKPDNAIKKTIAKLSSLFKRPLKHIWHEDKGFRKTTILNKAIEATQADYILMSDGDCIPEFNFVAKHMKYRKADYFLSGGYFKLSLLLSQMITLGDIENQSCFNINWLNTLVNNNMSGGGAL